MNKQEQINKVDNAVQDVKRLGNWFFRLLKKEETQAALDKLNAVVIAARQAVMDEYFGYYYNLPAETIIAPAKIWDVFVEIKQLQPLLDKINNANRFYNQLTGKR